MTIDEARAWQHLANVGCPHCGLIAVEMWSDGNSWRELRAGEALDTLIPGWSTFTDTRRMIARGSSGAHPWCIETDAHPWELRPQDQAWLARGRGRPFRQPGRPSGQPRRIQARRTPIRTA